MSTLLDSTVLEEGEEECREDQINTMPKGRR